EPGDGLVDEQAALLGRQVDRRGQTRELGILRVLVERDPDGVQVGELDGPADEGRVDGGCHWWFPPWSGRGATLRERRGIGAARRRCTERGGGVGTLVPAMGCGPGPPAPAGG